MQRIFGGIDSPRILFDSFTKPPTRSRTRSNFDDHLHSNRLRSATSHESPSGALKKNNRRVKHLRRYGRGEQRFDIPTVDVAINFDIPSHSKDYFTEPGEPLERVGRDDVELFQRIRGVIVKKMVKFVVDKEQAMLLKERAAETN
ncbi:ribosomal RNA processing protein [Tulasnella sp. 417]|nr:ribosomal RNA processing protein [Tulasnella sp. 417]